MFPLRFFLFFILASAQLAANAQTRTAALVYLTSYNPEVTFYNTHPPRSSEAPPIYIGNPQAFDFPRMFEQVKADLGPLLDKLGFNLIEEGSYMQTAQYQDFAKKFPDTNPTGFAAPGYAYGRSMNKFDTKGLFQAAPIPDILVQANIYFQVDYRTPGSIGEKSSLTCSMDMGGWDAQGKKVFQFVQRYVHPVRISVNLPNIYAGNCMILENISQKQDECIIGLFKELEEVLPRKLNDVTKFYAKQAH